MVGVYYLDTHHLIYNRTSSNSLLVFSCFSGCLTFSSDELSVIKYSVKEELTSLLAKIKE